MCHFHHSVSLGFEEVESRSKEKEAEVDGCPCSREGVGERGGLTRAMAARGGGGRGEEEGGRVMAVAFKRRGERMMNKSGIKRM